MECSVCCIARTRALHELLLLNETRPPVADSECYIWFQQFRRLEFILGKQFIHSSWSCSILLWFRWAGSQSGLKRFILMFLMALISTRAQRIVWPIIETVHKKPSAPRSLQNPKHKWGSHLRGQVENSLINLLSSWTPFYTSVCFMLI